MALPTVTDANLPTPEESLSQTLNDIQFAFSQRGLAANVDVGSDHYIRAQAFTRRVAIALANNEIANTNRSPLTAQGDELVELASTHGITPRPASSADGFLVVGVSGGGSVVIPADFTATAPSGETYKTTSAFTVSDGDSAEVIAVNTGAQTNQLAGTILTWNSGSIANLKQTATVDSGGLDGGVDEDSPETLRQRLLRRLANPEVGGTVAQVAQFAEEATAAVEQAFVHAAVRGPASYDVAVTKAGGDRTLSGTTVSTVSANITANMPGHADFNVTSVVAEPLDVVVNLSLPLPKSAGGSGGGWRDAVPWPSTADAVPPKIIAKGSGTVDVDSTSADPPVAGKRFGVWNPVNEEMLEFSTLSVSGGSGAYRITIDPASSDPLTGVQVGARVSAGALNLKQYASEFAAQMGGLGPGEKTDSIAILPRGRRQPGTDVEKPAALTLLQLGAVAANHAEIEDYSYAVRYLTGTTTSHSTPTIPPTTASPPRILTLKFLAFRRQA